MYCEKCGNEYVKAKFCPECGAPTNENSEKHKPPAPFQQYYSTTQKTIPKTQMTSPNKKPLSGVIAFLVIGVFAVVLIVIALGSNGESKEKLTDDIESSIITTLVTEAQETQKDKTNPITNKTTTLSEVETWYNGMISRVSSNFIDSLNSKTFETINLGTQNVSKTNITEIQFRFEADIGCYYLIYYKCKLGKYDCTGHARGFLEYNGTNIVWWSYELDYQNTAVVDYFDDFYDDYVIQYYDELVKTYK